MGMSKSQYKKIAAQSADVLNTLVDDAEEADNILDCAHEKVIACLRDMHGDDEHSVKLEKVKQYNLVII